MDAKVKEVADQPLSQQPEPLSSVGRQSMQGTADAKEQTMAPVSGFEKTGLMNNGDVQTYLQKELPSDHISQQRINGIYYEHISKANVDNQGNVRSYTLGECSTNRQTNISDITVFAQSPQGNTDQGKMEHTLVHEVGHNAYYNMGAEKMAAWDQISQTSKPDEYVSNCARTNMREDFAESYAAYVRDPQLLQETSQSKYDFMDREVF